MRRIKFFATGQVISEASLEVFSPTLHARFAGGRKKRALKVGVFIPFK